MKALRVATFVAVVAGALLAPAPAGAGAVVQQPFKADSGDACAHGSTAGVLEWQLGTSTSPLPVTAVRVDGTVTDHPVAADPTNCHEDGYFSTARFTAYEATKAIAEQDVKADNAVVPFDFTLTPPTSDLHIDRIVVQVCRDPLVTLPPSYCGTPVEYLAPPTA